MALNEVYSRAVQIPLKVGKEVNSGDPVLVGKLPGVALTDADETTEEATVQLEGAFRLVVYGYKKPETKEEELEIKVGEPVYLKETGKVLGGASTSTLFGYVLETVAKKGETAVIVKIATP